MTAELKPVLPGLADAVRAQDDSAAQVQGEKLTAELAAPIDPGPSANIEASPLFRGTDAAQQRELFNPEEKG